MPTPEGALQAAKATLAALALPDAVAARHPGMGFAAALPLLREIEATRKAKKAIPLKSRNTAMRPETAGHIARQLGTRFVSDTPDADLVAHIRAAFLNTGGDLMADCAALLDHPAACGGRCCKSAATD